jgi:hypothetical protein
VADEPRRAVELPEHRRQEQQRVDDVERVIADEEHTATGAEEPMQSFEVDDPMSMIPAERVRQGEKRPGRPGVGIDRCTPDGRCTRSPRSGHRSGGPAGLIDANRVGGQRLLASSLDHHPIRGRVES